MKAFCPQCGSDNEAQPGQRVTCAACTAVFTAPATIAQPVPAAPAPAPAPYAPPPQPAPVQPPHPQGPLIGTPPASNQPWNALAIASLVTGIVGCGPVSLVLGFLAIQQIDAAHQAQRGRGLAIAGIVLGFLGLCCGLGSFLLGIIGAASSPP